MKGRGKVRKGLKLHLAEVSGPVTRSGGLPASGEVGTSVGGWGEGSVPVCFEVGNNGHADWAVVASDSGRKGWVQGHNSVWRSGVAKRKSITVGFCWEDCAGHGVRVANVLDTLRSCVTKRFRNDEFRFASHDRSPVPTFLPTLLPNGAS